jgi:8-hydroxy-5-deazaflavin:NADPH oxidoreductase
MHVTIIGTGNMARGIGKRALTGGHDVTVVGKNSEHAEGAVAALRDGNGNGSVDGAVAGDPLAGDLVVLAVYYDDARAAVEAMRDDLADKPVVDVTNPVNDSFDGLVVPPDSSATEELAQTAPSARFVKAFNTTFASTLQAGEVGGQPLDVLIAGDDEGAKEAVATLVRDGGLNPVDVGGQRRARELESLGLLHMTVQDELGTGYGSAVKFVS